MATYYLTSAGSDTPPYGTELTGANSINSIIPLLNNGDIVFSSSSMYNDAFVAISGSGKIVTLNYIPVIIKSATTTINKIGYYYPNFGQQTSIPLDY